MIRSYMHLHLIVLLWGMSAVLGKGIEGSVGVFELILYRSIFSFLILGLLYLFFFRAKKIHSQTILEAKKTMPLWRYLLIPVIAGGILGLHWVFFFGAGRISTASVSLVGLTTTPLWVLVIEKITRRKTQGSPFDWFFALLSIASISLIYIGSFKDNSAILGISVSIGAAFLAALMTTFQAHFAHRYEPSLFTSLQFLGSGLVGLVFLLAFMPQKGVSIGPSFEWNQETFIVYGSLLLLTLVCTVYPYLIEFELLRRISAFTLNMTVNLEPVYGMIIAAAILGAKERMNTLFYVGMMASVFITLAQGYTTEYYRKKRSIKGSIL